LSDMAPLAFGNLHGMSVRTKQPNMQFLFHDGLDVIPSIHLIVNFRRHEEGTYCADGATFSLTSYQITLIRSSQIQTSLPTKSFSHSFGSYQPPPFVFSTSHERTFCSSHWSAQSYSASIKVSFFTQPRTLRFYCKPVSFSRQHRDQSKQPLTSNIKGQSTLATKSTPPSHANF